jgi:hypothetical protein
MKNVAFNSSRQILFLKGELDCGMAGDMVRRSDYGFKPGNPLHDSFMPLENGCKIRCNLISSKRIFYEAYLFLFFRDFYLTPARLYGTTKLTGRRSRKAA